jgi:hypothetical protein
VSRRLEGDSLVKPTRYIAKYLTLCSAAILIVACANQMEPAKNDLNAINAALTAATPDAQKYVPDQLASTQSDVAKLTASFDKKDYAAVVAGAPAALAEINTLAGAAAAKKDETLKALGNDWRSLEASVPEAVTAVQTRIDALSKTKRIPKDLDLNTAKSSLADATSAWEKAKSAFSSGNAEDAVTAGKDAKSKVEAAAAALKLNLTPAGQ